jgi:nitrous oxide reductase accessory protein NosL
MKMRKQYAAGAVLLIMMVFVGIMAHAGGDHNDIDRHRSCDFCGMDRKAYGFSRMLIQYEDGSETGVCSLHCAVTELDANKGRGIKALLVADRDARTLIDAEKAFWVIGGSKRGVMTQRPKWAFPSKAAAEAFIAEYGGKIVSWAEALAAAREELIRERR